MFLAHSPAIPPSLTSRGSVSSAGQIIYYSHAINQHQHPDHKYGEWIVHEIYVELYLTVDLFIGYYCFKLLTYLQIGISQGVGVTIVVVVAVVVVAVEPVVLALCNTSVVSCVVSGGVGDSGSSSLFDCPVAPTLRRFCTLAAFGTDSGADISSSSLSDNAIIAISSFLSNSSRSTISVLLFFSSSIDKAFSSSFSSSMSITNLVELSRSPSSSTSSKVIASNAILLWELSKTAGDGDECVSCCDERFSSLPSSLISNIAATMTVLVGINSTLLSILPVFGVIGSGIFAQTLVISLKPLAGSSVGQHGIRGPFRFRVARDAEYTRSSLRITISSILISSPSSSSSITFLATGVTIAAFNGSIRTRSLYSISTSESSLSSSEDSSSSASLSH
ncbi:hypothetical protein GQX74_006998 [Glossina fuscipes]|nr:hypothetical protein GQX74_006998 [Glossina fuscipes]